MKSIRGIVAGNHIERIAVLDRHVLQPKADPLRELILGIAHLFRHGAIEVVSKRAVEHRGERHFAQRPNSPGPLDRSEELRIGVDMRRVRMEIPTVQGFLDLLLQFGIADLGHPVEVSQFHIEVVDNLGLGRTLGKEDGNTAAECLGIDPMLRNKWEDMLQHGLLPAVVRNGSFHD